MKIQFLLPLSVLICISSIAMSANDDSFQALPMKAKQAVIRWNFKFKPFSKNDYTPEVQELFKKFDNNIQPMQVSGDFNGDKISDYALLGEADKQQYAIAVVSDKDDYKVVVVKSWSDADFKKSSVPGGNGKREGVPVYLALPDKEDDVAKQFKEKSKSDIFQLEAYMGASDDYAIKDSKAVKLNK